MRAKKLNSQMARNGNSLDVTLDIMLQAFDPKGDGDDATGYREKVQIPGGPNLTFFVVKENGQYKLLEDSEASQTRLPWRCLTGSRRAI